MEVLAPALLRRDSGPRRRRVQCETADLMDACFPPDLMFSNYCPKYRPLKLVSAIHRACSFEFSRPSCVRFIQEQTLSKKPRSSMCACESKSRSFMATPPRAAIESTDQSSAKNSMSPEPRLTVVSLIVFHRGNRLTERAGRKHGRHHHRRSRHWWIDARACAARSRDSLPDI